MLLSGSTQVTADESFRSTSRALTCSRVRLLSALARLVHDLGLTVVMAEHRLERVVPFADRIILVPGDGAPLVVGPPEIVMQTSPVAPPLVELGRLVDWDPLPLSVRDARRKSAPLRKRLAPIAPPQRPALLAPSAERVEAASARKLTVSYGAVVALDACPRRASVPRQTWPSALPRTGKPELRVFA